MGAWNKDTAATHAANLRLASAADHPWRPQKVTERSMFLRHKVDAMIEAMRERGAVDDDEIEAVAEDLQTAFNIGTEAALEYDTPATRRVAELEKALRDVAHLDTSREADGGVWEMRRLARVALGITTGTGVPKVDGAIHREAQMTGWRCDQCHKYHRAGQESCCTKRERLREEVDRLRTTVALIKHECGYHSGTPLADLIMEHARTSEVTKGLTERSIQRRDTLSAEVARLREALAAACPPERVRIVDDASVGPILEVYVRNDDGRTLHWAWLQTLSREHAATLRAALTGTPKGRPATDEERERWGMQRPGTPKGAEDE